MGGFLSELFFGKDYGKKDKKNIDSVWNPAAAQVSGLYGGAYSNQAKALGELSRGYADADKAAVGQAQQASRTVNDVYRQGEAADQQSAVSRGLFNTGSLDAMRRARRLDRSRSLSAIDAELGSLRAQLQIGQGQAMAQGYGGLANVQMNQASLLAQMAAHRSGQYSGIQYGKQGGLAPGLLQAGVTGFLAQSDRRLKEAIHFVGLANGHRVYEFSYIGQPGRYRGVMADEVAHVPGAVHEIEGFKFVDYSKLGFEMRRVA